MLAVADCSPYDEQYQACDAFHVFSYVLPAADGCRDDRFGSVLPGVIQQHAKLRKIRDCVQRSAVKRRVSPFGCLGLSFGRPAISLQNPLQASVEFYKIIIRPALFFPDSLPESVPRRQNPAGGSADRKDSRIAPDSERTFCFPGGIFPPIPGASAGRCAGGRAGERQGPENSSGPCLSSIAHFPIRGRR